MSRVDIGTECPGCKSKNVLTLAEKMDDVVIEGCVDCGSFWEAETRPDQTTPCDNCAFRPGSPEKSDPYNWAHLVEDMEEKGRPFYCHKRVPAEIKGDGYKFKHVIENGKCTNAPVCVGWIAWRLGQIKKRAKQITT